VSGGDVRSLLGALDRLALAGGCDRCNAVTEMRTDSDGVYIATVRHDDDCSDLARRRPSAR